MLIPIVFGGEKGFRLVKKYIKFLFSLEIYFPIASILHSPPKSGSKRNPTFNHPWFLGMAILGGYFALHHSLKSSLESRSPRFDAISLVISLDLTLLILFFSGFPSKLESIVSSLGFHQKHCWSHFIIHFRSMGRI